MRKSIIITALVAGFGGFVLGNAFFYLAGPLFFDKKVEEALPANIQAARATTKTVATGSFTDTDTFHRGQGRVEILTAPDGSSIVRFTGFNVTNGPDLKVWLLDTPAPRSSADVRKSRYLSLGPLKGNVGDQNYLVPPGTPLAAFGSVVIWCEQFGVLFSAAPLAAASS